jgi:hypothetical protein
MPVISGLHMPCIWRHGKINVLVSYCIEYFHSGQTGQYASLEWAHSSSDFSCMATIFCVSSEYQVQEVKIWNYYYLHECTHKKWNVLVNNIAKLGQDYYNFKHCLEKCFAERR